MQGALQENKMGRSTTYSDGSINLMTDSPADLSLLVGNSHEGFPISVSEM